MKRYLAVLALIGGTFLTTSTTAQVDNVNCALLPEEDRARCEAFNKAAERLRGDCSGANGPVSKSTCPIRIPMMRDTHAKLVSRYGGAQVQSAPQQSIAPIAARPVATSRPVTQSAPRQATGQPIASAQAPLSVGRRGIADEQTIFGFQLGKTYEQQGINECTRKDNRFIIYPRQTPAQKRAYDSAPPWDKPKRHQWITRWCGYEFVDSNFDESRTCWRRTIPSFNARHKSCFFADHQGSFLPETPNESGRFFRRQLYYIGPAFPRFIGASVPDGKQRGRRINNFILDEQKRIGAMTAGTHAQYADEARTALIGKYGKPTRIERDAYLIESGAQVTLDKYIWEKPHIYVEYSPISPSTFTKYKAVEVLSGSRIDRLLGIPALARVPTGTGTDFKSGFLQVMLPSYRRELNTDRTVRQGL